MPQNPHCPHKSQEAMNKWKEERKLVIQSKNHDRHTCNCEGCRLFWVYSVIIGRNGQLYEVVPSIKDIPFDMWSRDFMMAMWNRVMCPLRYSTIDEKGKVVVRGLWKVFYSNKVWVMREA